MKTQLITLLMIAAALLSCSKKTDAMKSDDAPAKTTAETPAPVPPGDLDDIPTEQPPGKNEPQEDQDGQDDDDQDNNGSSGNAGGSQNTGMFYAKDYFYSGAGNDGHLDALLFEINNYSQSKKSLSIQKAQAITSIDLYRNYANDLASLEIRTSLNNVNVIHHYDGRFDDNSKSFLFASKGFGAPRLKLTCDMDVLDEYNCTKKVGRLYYEDGAVVSFIHRNKLGSLNATFMLKKETLSLALLSWKDLFEQTSHNLGIHGANVIEEAQWKTYEIPYGRAWGVLTFSSSRKEDFVIRTPLVVAASGAVLHNQLISAGLSVNRNAQQWLQGIESVDLISNKGDGSIRIALRSGILAGPLSSKIIIEITR